uniref:Uncharacterized protein n=1 Tax=Acrobeloides nanus TaxID=290746 RepID=A0A914CRQ9_9BILA
MLFILTLYCFVSSVDSCLATRPKNVIAIPASSIQLTTTIPQQTTISPQTTSVTQPSCSCPVGTQPLIYTTSASAASTVFMPPDNQCTTCTPPNTILGCWPPTQTDDPCTLVFGTASISFACPTASCICDENNVCYSPNSNPADYGFAFFPICTTPSKFIMVSNPSFSI